MELMFDPLHVEVLDPRYDAGPGFLIGADAAVCTNIERADWAPITPPPANPGSLAFVDGIQRTEAWLRTTSKEHPSPVAGAAVAIGVGCVVVDVGARIALGETTIERSVVVAGPDVLDLPTTNGIIWHSLRAVEGHPDPIDAAVSSRRTTLEQQLAERLTNADRLVVIDGGLKRVRAIAGPVMGAVKSHQRRYVDDEHAATITALAIGQRTPLFSIGSDRYSWYQRLPLAYPHGWAGILRGELPRDLSVAEAIRLANRATRELPRYAGREHRDPRAPQNLTPVAALEKDLRRRLGDPRLALRAVRRAAARAQLHATEATT